MSSKKSPKDIHTYYELTQGGLRRKLKKCPRCGAFMALHKQPVERWTCGACSYTEYIQAETRK